MIEPFGVDFDHIGIPDAIIAGHSLRVVGDSITALMEQFSLTERSGLRIDQLGGQVAVSGKGIIIEELDLRTPVSSIGGRLAMTAESWRSFNDFTTEVPLRFDLKPSRLNFSDIAWFAPQLKGIDFPIAVSGKVRGTIAELWGRELRSVSVSIVHSPAQPN
ncbi:MAG: hypothetical protein IPJ85_12000 [Flavobacteriales bacterium]|nr:hypothetical protein [Flavobacteriales bacterium]